MANDPARLSSLLGALSPQLNKRGKQSHISHEDTQGDQAAVAKALKGRTVGLGGKWTPQSHQDGSPFVQLLRVQGPFLQEVTLDCCLGACSTDWRILPPHVQHKYLVGDSPSLLGALHEGPISSPDPCNKLNRRYAS